MLSCGRGAMTAAKSIAAWSSLPNLNCLLLTKRAEAAYPQKADRQAKEKKPREGRANFFSGSAAVTFCGEGTATRQMSTPSAIIPRALCAAQFAATCKRLMKKIFWRRWEVDLTPGASRKKLGAQRRRHTLLYKGIAAASVTFCGEEEWRSGMRNPQSNGWGF